MTYQVFISYTRSDADWAHKIAANLRNRGVSVFLDESRITAGDEWGETLRGAIVESQALVVLWSNAAAQSKWVTKEQEAFRQMMHVDSREGRASTRRMLQLCLDAKNVEYSEFQRIEDLYQANSHVAGAANVDPNVWNRVVERIAAAMEGDANLRIVHQVILASKEDMMQGLADDVRPAQDAARYGDLIAGLNFLSKQELIARYGDERSEWRPFGGQKSVLTILNELREELLSRGVTPFLWKPISEAAWTGIEGKKRVRDLLAEEPCVIVLDPVSLYDAEVRERYEWLLACLQNPKAAIVVLPPYSSRERHYLQRVLEAAAARMFEPFYQPDRVSVPIAASCSLMADDRYEVSRVVGNMIRTAFGKGKNAKLRFCAARQ